MVALPQWLVTEAVTAHEYLCHKDTYSKVSNGGQLANEDEWLLNWLATHSGEDEEVGD